MPLIKIGNRLIGDGQPTYVIAEIGVNHNGFLDLALKLIDVAVDAGADAVKFQKRNIDKLYARKYLENANSGEKTLRYLLPILQQVELPDDLGGEMSAMEMAFAMAGASLDAVDEATGDDDDDTGSEQKNS